MTDPNVYEKPPPYTPFPNVQSETFPPSVSSGASNQWIPQQQMPQQMPQQFGGFPNYGSTVVVQSQPQVIIVGGCPVCRVGILEDDFTCFGIFMAIIFFPIGLLCCMVMRQRRCPNCGAVFD